jgi:hypothetical protein
MEVNSQLHVPAALLRGKNIRTHWIGGWVGPRASLDVVEQKKKLIPAEFLTPVVQPKAGRCTDWVMPTVMRLQYFSKIKTHVFNILELELCLLLSGIYQSTITDSREICCRRALIFVFNTIFWSRFIPLPFGRVTYICIHRAHHVNAFLLLCSVSSYQFFHFDISSYLTENGIAKACDMREKKRNASWISAGKPEQKGPLRRVGRGWEDNIKMNLRELGGDGIDWINLTEDMEQWRALVNTAMNFRVP